MTLTQFRYVLEIARTGSVNQAAAHLFVSQSVLSNALKTLEDELQEKIFYRTTKGMELTPFGENFVAYISPIQLQMDQLNTMLSRNAAHPSVSLKIATTAFYQMSVMLSSFLHRYASSDIRIELIETSLEEAMNMIANDVLDLAFIRRWSCYYNVTNKRLQSMKLDYSPLKAFPMGVAIGEGNPLFHEPIDSIDPKSLGSFPCIIYNYLENGPYHDIYDRLGIPINSRVVTNSRAVMYELLKETPGYFLNADLPDLTSPSDRKKGAKKDAAPVRRTLRLENCSVNVEYGWITHRGHVRSAVEDECIHAVSQWLRSQD